MPALAAWLAASSREAAAIFAMAATSSKSAISLMLTYILFLSPHREPKFSEGSGLVLGGLCRRLGWAAALTPFEGENMCMRGYRGSGLNRVTLTIRGRQLSRRDQRETDSISKGGQGVHMASILIVEDDEHLRLAAESFLADEGHHTLTATTAEQALALLAAGVDVDLVLVDIVLNGDINAGLTLARRAADVRKNLKVVYTTGQLLTDGMRALLVPCSAILPRSFTVDQIRTALFSNFGIRSPGENLA